MINELKLQREIGFTPHKGQKQVLKSKSKEIIIVAGRGWGKSMFAAYEVVRSFLQGLEDIREGKRKAYKVWVVAPTYQLTEKVFQYIAQFLITFDKKSFAPMISGGQNRPYMLKLNENVWIQCKSTTEPQGLLGERVDLEIVDEAALIPERVYFQNIKPSVSALGGRIIFISTPRGKNWFRNKYLVLKEQGSAFHFRSIDGVHYNLKTLNAIKKDFPDLLWRQEYEAEFVDEAGTVFKNIDDIIGSTEKDAELGHFYTMGVDLAQSEDYTVMTVIDNLTKEVVHIDRFKGRAYPLQKLQIAAKARRYNNARVIIDATGVGRPIYEDLTQEGLFVEDFSFSGRAKEELIGKLIVYIEEKYIKIPKNQGLIDELKAFEYKYINEKTGLPLKNIKYSAPKGYHDDYVDSLALAVWGLNSGKPIPITRVLKKKGRRIRSFI